MADQGSGGEEQPEREGVRGAVLRGSVLTLVMRWLSRLTGLVSTVILVRILSPEDFGLVAMAMIVVGLVDLFADTAVDLALIRHPNPDRTHFDSAWSVSALAGAGLALLLIVIASPVATYFAEPRVEFIIYALSLKTFFVGLENIGVVWFRRNLDFVSEFRYTVVRRTVPKFVTVALAFVYEDYRALVYGEMIGAAFALALSYYVHPFRPWPNLSKVRELWSFSLWILVADLGEYLHLSVGRLVVGSVTNAATLGRFSIAEELSRLPQTELVGPVSRPLYPAYSRFYDDRERLLDAYLNVLSVTAAIAASTAAGIAIVAEDLLAVVFGAKWVSVAPTMTWLALACGVASLSASVSPVLNALGMARRTAILTWTSYGVMLAGLLVAAGRTSDIVTLAAVQAVVTVSVVPVYFFQLRKFLPFTWRQLGRTLWRPVIAACVMAAVLLPTKLLTGEVPAAARLIFEVALGAIVFTGVLMLLWTASGRPKGVEQIGTEVLLQAKERIWKLARSR
jgi:O-antigen/teichoic acid export membrane protein